MSRFAYQTEAFGLSAGQRTTAASIVNSALDTLDPADVIDRDVRQSFTIHGVTEFFAQADFISDNSGATVFNASVNWLSSRAADASDGRHSYVRVINANENTRIITTRYAESPGWVGSVGTSSLDAAKVQ